MKKFSSVLLLSAITAISYTQLPEATRIISESREKSISGDLSSTISLVITERNGVERKRTIDMLSKSYQDGTEKRLVRFTEPADVRGTSLLIYDHSKGQDEMWIWLPALKKTRRLASSDKNRSFMSSEFSNSDMSSPDPAEFIHSHLPSSGKDNMYVIESKPVDEKKADEYGISRKITYLTMGSLRPVKTEFYDFENKLFKTIEIKETRELPGGKYTVTAMTASNLSNGRKSEFRTLSLKASVKEDDSVFSLSSLEQ